MLSQVKLDEVGHKIKNCALIFFIKFKCTSLNCICFGIVFEFGDKNNYFMCLKQEGDLQKLLPLFVGWFMNRQPVGRLVCWSLPKLVDQASGCHSIRWFTGGHSTHISYKLCALARGCVCGGVGVFNVKFSCCSSLH